MGDGTDKKENGRGELAELTAYVRELDRDFSIDMPNMATVLPMALLTLVQAACHHARFGRTFEKEHVFHPRATSYERTKVIVGAPGRAEDVASYVRKWLACASKTHGLTTLDAVRVSVTAEHGVVFRSFHSAGTPVSIKKISANIEAAALQSLEKLRRAVSSTTGAIEATRSRKRAWEERNKGAEEPDTCAVCLEAVTDAVVPECGHALCRICFDSLVVFNADPPCPSCRKKIKL